MVQAAASIQAWAHWVSCPADWVHPSWLPSALIHLQTGLATRAARQVVHQMLEAHLQLPAFNAHAIQDVPGADLCLLPAKALHYLTLPDPQSDVAAWHATAWPGNVLGMDSAARQAVQQERAICLLLQLASCAWPAALAQRWRLRFDKAVTLRAEMHRLPMGRPQARDRLHSLQLLAQKLGDASTPAPQDEALQP